MRNCLCFAQQGRADEENDVKLPFSRDLGAPLHLD